MRINSDMGSVENREVKAEIYNFQEWIRVTDPSILKRDFNELLLQSGYNILNFMDYTFPNGGYTSIWLLAESHLAIHTFVSEGRSYIELSGCSEEMSERFKVAFNRRFLKDQV